MYRYVLFILLLCCTAQLYAQPLKPADFDQYTTANGLSDNAVNGIAEDAKGYIWLTTLWGLNRFDGNRFINYYSNNDSNSIPSNDLWDLNWLDDKRFAIYGTAVHIVNTATAAQQNLFIPYHEKKHQFKFNMTMKVMGDEGGNIYVLSRSGFYHFTKNHELISRFDYYKDNEVPLHHFVFGAELLEIDKTRLLIISVNGLYVYDKSKKRLERVKAGDFPLLDEFMSYPDPPLYFFQVRPGEFFVFKINDNLVVHVDLQQKKRSASKVPIDLRAEIGWRSKLLAINDSCFYITGQQSGIYTFYFNRETGSVKFDPAKQLEIFSCNTIVKGRDGRLMIGTNKGLLRQKLQKPVVETTMLPAGLQEQYPNTRFDDIYLSGDKIYAATREAGLAVFDKASFNFERNILFNHIDAGSNYVRALAGIDAKTLMVGVQGRLILFNTITGSTTPVIPRG
ncbi:MAG TPA: two-component regulator propeller domain-containing protein, partial [Chitinophagaceae bacterium]